MRVTFLKVRPEDISLLPQKALDHIQTCINKTPGNTETLGQVLADCERGTDQLYLICQSGVIGCIVLHETEDTLNPHKMGVDDLETVRDDLLKFLKSYNKKVICVTRLGWQKIFPEFRMIGGVYSLDKPR